MNNPFTTLGDRKKNLAKRFRATLNFQEVKCGSEVFLFILCQTLFIQFLNLTCILYFS